VGAVLRLAAGVPVALAALAAGCGGAGDGSDGDGGRAERPPASPFVYDREAPLRFRDAGILNRGFPIAIHDVSYASPRGGRVRGLLLVPPGEGRRAAVVYLHGSGGAPVDLIPLATWMAARGAVTLSVESAYARAQGPSPAGVEGLRRQRDLEAQTVVDLRRAVDLLGARRDVDPERIGFVGYSAGARSGAILAGVEPRIVAFGLMSGGASPVAEYADAAPVGLRRDVRRMLGQVDPLRWVRRARSESLFLQNGRRDAVVPESALRALARAAPHGTRVRWYDAGHPLSRRAYRDQLAWLSKRLGLGGPVVRGVPPEP
jgi:dienelactone hydrolase